jgi:excisionase family DNA binding protein
MLTQVITAKEAAKLLGVTPRQVQNMCKAGKLEARYADGVWLILRMSLLDAQK